MMAPARGYRGMDLMFFCSGIWLMFKILLVKTDAQRGMGTRTVRKVREFACMCRARTKVVLVKVVS